MTMPPETRSPHRLRIKGFKLYNLTFVYAKDLSLQKGERLIVEMEEFSYVSWEQ